MSKSDTFEALLIDLIFKAVADSELAATVGSATNLYVSLHTGDPTDGGNQSSSEIAYTGYARKDVARGAGWTRTGNSVSPAAAVTFGAMTAGAGGTVTHFGVGTGSTGTGKLLYSGAVSPTIAVTAGVTPQLTTATAITED